MKSINLGSAIIDTQIMYYCNGNSGLQKTQCKEKTVLLTKSVRFFQDETNHVNHFIL